MVVPALAGAWPFSLPGDPLARWIDTSPAGHSALFAIDFTLAQTFTSARLRIELAADDLLHLRATQVAKTELEHVNKDLIAGHRHVRGLVLELAPSVRFGVDVHPGMLDVLLLQPALEAVAIGTPGRRVDLEAVGREEARIGRLAHQSPAPASHRRATLK